MKALFEPLIKKLKGRSHSANSTYLIFKTATRQALLLVMNPDFGLLKIVRLQDK